MSASCGASPAASHSSGSEGQVIALRFDLERALVNLMRTSDGILRRTRTSVSRYAHEHQDREQPVTH